MKPRDGRIPPPGPRRDPKPYFEAGQRVVCVNAAPSRLAPDNKVLVAGKIYVIRAIDLGPSWKWPWWGVHLEGLRVFYPGNDALEWALTRPASDRLQNGRPTSRFSGSC
jgi:hypothetical protein